ncbi:hypothetical protein CALCODRAFT_281059 [Calocera cornea HHB12733]|uniref:Uncharacterized protein n=1 Tax=Calocera cornea HHB12733 TaxID=1353952 RepID=A0A165G0N4_9BASI|nr:hypothetical protein CALCODRAFT_281059 [Calocera cornea HHB12733]
MPCHAMPCHHRMGGVRHGMLVVWTGLGGHATGRSMVCMRLPLYSTPCNCYVLYIQPCPPPWLQPGGEQSSAQHRACCARGHARPGRPGRNSLPEVSLARGLARHGPRTRTTDAATSDAAERPALLVSEGVRLEVCDETGRVGKLNARPGRGKARLGLGLGNCERADGGRWTVDGGRWTVDGHAGSESGGRRNERRAEAGR